MPAYQVLNRRARQAFKTVYTSGVPRENHREKLLRGALQCLREKGYARTTARDIAAASESNLGSIGYHFGSKEALLNEAIREGCTQWTDQLERIAFSHEGATPIERLQAAWRGLAETLEEERALLVAFIEALAQAEHSEELRGQLADLYEESRAAIRQMVEASLGTVELADDHARACASFLIAVCEGLLLQWLVDPERAPSGEALIAGLSAALPMALAADARAPAGG
jgi:AcrR family transcriptional regulator